MHLRRHQIGPKQTKKHSCNQTLKLQCFFFAIDCQKYAIFLVFSITLDSLKCLVFTFYIYWILSVTYFRRTICILENLSLWHLIYSRDSREDLVIGNSLLKYNLNQESPNFQFKLKITINSSSETVKMQYPKHTLYIWNYRIEEYPVSCKTL